MINPVTVELGERLLALLGVTEGRILMCNSGAEANEAAFKIARRTGRPKIVSAVGGFHGRTMGALALTGQPAKREPFEPMPPGVEFVPYGDVEALRAIVDADTAAVVLEPIQGESGVIIPPEGYLQAAREITAEQGALLVVDEVQTGIGRTGVWFAHQRAGHRPGRRHPGQGPRRRAAARGVRRDRAGRRAAGPRAARHHLRRQPGLLRRRAGRARHHRPRRAPRPRGRAGQGPRPRGSRAWTTRWSTTSTPRACSSASRSPPTCRAR